MKKGNTKGDNYIKNTEALTLRELDRLLDQQSGNINLLMKRAELKYKNGLYGASINDYNKVIELQPENKHAKAQVDIISTILRYTNTDIFASTNTNMDPWFE